MPPINPQGSRGGLITTVVIMSVLFVTSTIFAIYFHTQQRAREKDIADLQSKYKQFVSDVYMSSPEATNIKASLASNPAYRNLSTIEAVAAQRNEMAKLITGTGNPTPPADQQVAEAMRPLADANGPEADLKLSASDSLLTALKALTTKVGAIREQNTKLVQAAKEADDARNQTIADQKNLLGERDTAVAAERAKVEAELKTIATEREQKATQVKSISDETTKTVTRVQGSANELTKQVAQRDAAIKQLQTDLDKAQRKLAGIRMDTKNAVIRQPDGHITRIPDSTTVYIDLGEGDQVAPGLTFAVYDKRKGIPPLGQGMSDSDTDMPVGKGSIEVVRVGPGSSECRVVKLEPGQSLVEGDIIANLVYDRNTKYNFLVYGNFDMDQNGVATADDAKIIQRLVTQWGGRLTDKVDADTDFVVLGKAPTVPTLSDEDKNNPIEQKRAADAQAALEAYTAVETKAAQLYVPVLNQNRFLYFVGYFDQSKR